MTKVMPHLADFNNNKLPLWCNCINEIISIIINVYIKKYECLQNTEISFDISYFSRNKQFIFFYTVK